MARMRDRLDAPVLIGVGAAFDFHAGLIPQAPPMMQRCGLEWLFRLRQEPRRLWRRYLTYNPRFVLGFARQYARRRVPLTATRYLRARMRRIACCCTRRAAAAGSALATGARADVFDDNPATASRGPGDTVGVRPRAPTATILSATGPAAAGAPGRRSAATRRPARRRSPTAATMHVFVRGTDDAIWQNWLQPRRQLARLGRRSAAYATSAPAVDRAARIESATSTSSSGAGQPDLPPLVRPGAGLVALRADRRHPDLGAGGELAGARAR